MEENWDINVFVLREETMNIGYLTIVGHESTNEEAPII